MTVAYSKQKKLMLLGGGRYLIPIINKAHEIGAYVITCDYLPGNIAHRFSDEYVNVSIIDQEAVLKAAKEREIDGIMSFACDPGVVPAAYVAEKLGLPFQCSHEVAQIFQDKGKFRKFLMENKFNCPNAKSYSDLNALYSDIECFRWPVIVKPTDGSGSKGVTRVESPDELEDAVALAIENSRNKEFIVEEFLTFKGYHSSTDPFTVDGKLAYITYSDQLFDENAENPYTPSLIIWPTTMEKKHQDYLTTEIQRAFDLLGVKNGIYNIETCVDIDGNPYIMEISPRGGGCKIAEIQELSMGAKTIENEIRQALNLPTIPFEIHECDGHWCEMVIHSKEGGIFDSIDIEQSVHDKYVKVIDIAVEKGDIVKPFTGASMSLGDIFLRFDTREELDRVMKTSNEWLRIKLING